MPRPSPFHSIVRARLAAAALAMTCGLAGAQPAASPTSPSAPQPERRIQARFACADGRSIAATFINAPPHSRVQLAFSDGRRMTLPQALSGSGARYANQAGTVVFWNKGRTAFVQEQGRTTFADCATVH